MRGYVAIASLVLLLLPTIASAGAHTGRCRTLSKQIVHYEGVADMASSRRDRLWLRATEQHIARLQNKRSELCPAPARNKAVEMVLMTRDLVVIAGRGARNYFTGGW